MQCIITECTECDHPLRRGLIVVSWVPLCKQQSLLLHEMKAWLSFKATVGPETLAFTNPTDMPRQRSSSSLIADLTGSKSMSKDRQYTSRSCPGESWRQRQHLDAGLRNVGGAHGARHPSRSFLWADKKPWLMQDNGARGLGLLHGIVHPAPVRPFNLAASPVSCKADFR